MFHEYREEITKLKIEDKHFASIFTKHNELDDKIASFEKGREHISEAELEDLKKEKLKLKDEAYNIIIKFKNKS